MDKILTVDKNTLFQISKGDSSAFEILYKIYHNRIYSYSYYFTKNQLDSEEMLQEIFTKIWSKRSMLVEVENISQWMKAITRNHCITYLKKKALIKRKEYESHLYHPNCVSNSEDALLRSELETQLALAMQQLTTD